MKVTKYTGITEENAKKMVKGLNEYLATLHVHYSNLRTHHWHVLGKFFFDIHKATEELYDEAFEQIDEVAERILMLDGVPVRKFDEVLMLSKLKETETLVCPRQIVEYILETTKLLIELERELLELADELGDVVTNDLLTGYIVKREKLAWMYVAFLTKGEHK